MYDDDDDDDDDDDNDSHCAVFRNDKLIKLIISFMVLGKIFDSDSDGSYDDDQNHQHKAQVSEIQL